MKIMPNDWNISWIHEKNEFLPDKLNTDENDDSSNSIWID